MSDLNAEIAQVDAELDYAEDYGSDEEIEALRERRWELIDRESKQRSFANAPMGTTRVVRTNPPGDPLAEAQHAVASARGRLDSIPVASPEREAADQAWHAAKDSLAELEKLAPFAGMDDAAVKGEYDAGQIHVEELREALAAIPPGSRHRLEKARADLATAEKHVQLIVSEDQRRGHIREQEETLARIYNAEAYKARQRGIVELERLAEAERIQVEDPDVINGVRSYRSPERLNSLLNAIEKAKANLNAPLHPDELEKQRAYWLSRGQQVLERAGSPELFAAKREAERQRAMFGRGR